MLPTVLALLALAGLLAWLLLPSRKPRPAPEDDITTPINEAELAQAERELAEDPRPRALDQADEERDDWGPGTR